MRYADNPIIYNSYFKDNIPVFLNVFSERKEQNCIFHKHDFIEIAYVSSGRGYHLVNDMRYPVSKGDLSIINYSVPHVFIQNEEDPAGEFVVFNCIFKPEFIDYSLVNTTDFKNITASLLFNTFFVEDKPAICLKLSSLDQREIEDVYKRMHIEYTMMLKGYLNMLRSNLLIMLTKIFRILESSANDHYYKNKHKYDIIEQTLNFLKSNYSSNELNIDEVALRTFLSKGYLSRLFKNTTGEYFSTYLQKLRISEACKLLATTDKKVIDIVSDVGLRDIKHFNALFKKITGKTPKEYRKFTSNNHLTPKKVEEFEVFS